MAQTTLDNSMPNAYCNVALVMLYQLPWVRVHCLASLMRSQFVLTDELGFLYHMMDRSRGAACRACARRPLTLTLTLTSGPLTRSRVPCVCPPPTPPAARAHAP